MMNFLIDYKSIEDDVVHIQTRSMLDPNLSDIDFKNKMAWVWTTLNLARKKIIKKVFFAHFLNFSSMNSVTVKCF